MKKIRPIKTEYIHTPIKVTSPVKIDAILEKRMKEFLLSRRQRRWIEVRE